MNSPLTGKSKDWKIEFTPFAQKEIAALDKPVRARIKWDILTKLLPNPTTHLLPLKGDRAGFYKFRVGDYRLLCSKQDKVLTILIVRIKHRKNIYQRR